MAASELRKTKYVAAKAQANTCTEEPTESAWLGFEETPTAADGITSAEAKMRAMMSKITERNRQQSPLLRLPGELRNRIYEYAIGGNEVEPKFPSMHSFSFILHAGPYSETSGHGQANWWELLCLSKSCKQLYKETRLLPWSLNIFRAPMGESFGQFLHQLKDWQKEAITTVSFGFKGYLDDTDPRVTYEGIVPDGMYACTGLKTAIRMVTLSDSQKKLVEEFAELRELELIDESEGIQDLTYDDEVHRVLDDDSEEERHIYRGLWR